MGDSVGKVAERVETLLLEPLNKNLYSRRLMQTLGMFPSFEDLDDTLKRLNVKLQKTPIPGSFRHRKKSKQD